MKPAVSERNFTPNSIALVSGSWGALTELFQIEQGHGLWNTLTSTCAPGLSRLPLSSTARALIVVLPIEAGVQE